MDKGNFKVGDKVRLKNPRQFRSLGTKILTIIGVACGSEFIPVTFDGMRGMEHFPLKPCEIEYVEKIGEQLVFSFMKGD